MAGRFRRGRVRCPWRSDRPGRCAASSRPVTGGEHGPVQPLQLGTGVHAELVGDDLAGLPVGSNRLGVPPGTLKRPDEQAPELFPEWLVADQSAQLWYQLIMPPAAQLGLGPQLQRGQAGLFKPSRFGGHQRRRRHIRKRAAPPQSQRLGQHDGRALRVPGAERLPALRHEQLRTIAHPDRQRTA